jgi:hypothetical protein
VANRDPPAFGRLEYNWMVISPVLLKPLDKKIEAPEIEFTEGLKDCARLVWPKTAIHVLLARSPWSTPPGKVGGILSVTTTRKEQLALKPAASVTR